MADSPFEQVLIALGLDLSGVREGASKVQAILDGLTDQSQEVASRLSSAIGGNRTSYTELLALVKETKTTVQETTAQERTKTSVIGQQVSTAKSLAAEAKAHLDQQKLVTEQQRTQTQEFVKQRAEIAKNTAMLQQQMATIRKERLEAQGERRAEGGGGIGTSLLQQLTKGLLGGGLAGGVAGGILAGEGIRGAIDAIGEFVAKLKEITIESGKLSLVQDQFEKLARGAGIDANEAISKLSESTEGLVTRFELLKLANAALKSPLGVSMTQVQQMTGDVVKLAEASGHTAQEGIGALTRALETGRFMSLAAVTGLSRYKLQVEELPPGLNRVQRSVMEVTHAMGELHKQAELAGDMPQTIEQMMTRLRVGTHDLMTSFGVGVNQSSGTQLFIKLISDMVKGMDGAQDKAKQLGIAIGDMLAVVGVAVKDGIITFKELFAVIKDIFGVLNDATKGLGGLEKLPEAGDKTVESFKKLHPVLFDAAELIININGLLQISLGIIDLGVRKLHDLATNPALMALLGAAVGARVGGVYGAAAGAAVFGGAAMYGQTAPDTTPGIHRDVRRGRRSPSEDILSYLQRPPEAAQQPQTIDEVIKRVNESMLSQMKELATGLASKPPGGTGAIPPEEKAGGLSKAEQGKIAAERLKLQQETNKALLHERQLELQREKEADQEAYTAGERTLEEHLAKQNEIAQSEYEIRLTDLKQNLAAQLAELTQMRKLDRINEIEYQLKSASALVSFLDQRTAAEKQKESQQFANQKQALNDRLQATRKNLQEELASQQEAIRAEQALNEKRFAEGRTSPNDYFQERLALSERLAEVEAENANKVFQANQKNLAARAELEKKLHLIIQKYQEDETKFAEDEGQKRLSTLEKLFRPQQQAIEGQVGFQQQYRGRQTFETPTTDLITQLTGSLAQYRTGLLQLANNPVVKQDVVLWYQVVDAIEKAYEQEARYNEELIKTKDILPDVANALGEITNQIGSIFHSRFAQGLVDVLKLSGEALSKTTERINTIMGRTTTPTKTPEQLALEAEARDLTTVLKRSGTSVDQIVGPFNSAGKAATDLANTLHRAIEIMAIPLSANHTPALGLFGGGLVPGAASGVSGKAAAAKAGQGTAGDFYAALWAAGLVMGIAAPPQVVPEAPTERQFFIPTFRPPVALAPIAPTLEPPPEIQQSTQDLTEALKALTSAITDTTKTATGPGGGTTGTSGSQSLFQNIIGAFTGIGGLFGHGKNIAPEDVTQENANAYIGSDTESPFSSKQGMQQALGQVQAFVGAIGGFIQTITSSKSTLAGALGGGMQGASIGNQLGGPIGAAVGAAVGAVLGGIVGHKEAQVQRNIVDATNKFNNIMENFAVKPNDLTQAIVELEALVAMVKAEQASSKKGHGDYQKLIDQYTQQIKDLEIQQAQVGIDLNKQLGVLKDQNLAQQQYLQTLQQIFAQYDKIVGASTTLLGLGQQQQSVEKANLFLKQSIAVWEYQNSQQALQDNQQAINDALNLNDLLYQRQQLILSTNVQIEGILSQGVLVRQPTRAMTAGQQIQQIQVEANRQLQVMNEEISAAQYRVSAEGQIYNLRMSAAGLELQLLALQNQQTDADMQRIKGLKDLVGAFSGGGPIDWASLFKQYPLIAQLWASLGGVNLPFAIPPGMTPPTVTGSTPVTAPPNPMPPGETNPIPGQRNPWTGRAVGPASKNLQGTNALDYLISQAYQDRATLGFASYRGTNL